MARFSAARWAAAPSPGRVRWKKKNGSKHSFALAGSHPNYLAGREKYLMIILKSGGGREISLTLCRGHPSFFWNFLLESIGAPDHRAIDDHQGARHHDFQIWRQNNFDNLVNMRWLQDVEFE